MTAVEWLINEFELYYNGESQLFYYQIIEQAKEMEKEQQGYSEEDLIEFSEWVSHNDWVYLPRKSYWVNEEQEELEQKFTTKELFEQFKNK
jgi:hypothetical protein